MGLRGEVYCGSLSRNDTRTRHETQPNAVRNNDFPRSQYRPLSLDAPWEADQPLVESAAKETPGSRRTQTQIPGNLPEMCPRATTTSPDDHDMMWYPGKISRTQLDGRKE